MDMVVDSRYEMLERIGSGGMGEVWRARDTVLEREVAIKVLAEALNHEPTRLRRFEREARAVAGLTHPNIVAVFDFGSHEGTPFSVMELLQGRDLSQRLDGGRLNWNEATDIALDIVRGLHAAHSGGIIHRDLKPANVFLCDDGAVKILDFGLARLHGQGSGESVTAAVDPTLTEHGTVVGTVGYMAPEQVRGLPADVRSDVFSFGCVVYEMLSGRRPFGRGSSADVMAAILRDEPESLDAEIPQALAAVVGRCLHKDPDERFGSAAEVMAALEAIRASGDRIPARAPSGERKWRVPARLFGLRPLAWVAALGVLGLVLGYVLVGWRSRPAPPEPRPNLAPNRIAVVPFANRSGDPSLDDLGRRAADRIIREMAGVEEIQVAPISVVAGTAGGRAPLGAVARSLVHEVATATSSGLVLVGLIYTSGIEIEIQATLENAASGRTVRSFDTLRSPRQDVDTSFDTLAGWVFVSAMEELHPSLRFGSGDRIPDPAAFREFLAALPIAGIDRAAYDHYWKALELDPEFDRIRLYGAIASWSSGNWQLSDQVLRPLEDARSRLTQSQQKLVDAARWALDGRWGGSLGILREYSADNPDDCMARAAVIKGAMATNQPRLALEEFEHYRWDPVQPSNQMKVIFFHAARAYHQLGQHEQELAVLRTLWNEHQRFFGTSWFRQPEARALVALGRIDECREAVAKALTEPVYRQSHHGEMMVSIAEELRAHGYQGESRVMAQRALDWFEHTELPPDSALRVQGASITALALLGHNEQAYQIATTWLADQPDSWLIQAEVGVGAARIGDRTTAERMSRKLVEVDQPFTMGWPSFHRATIAAQLGQSSEAIRLLQQAISRGFHNFDLLSVDLNLEPLRDHPEFQEIVRPKG